MRPLPNDYLERAYAGVLGKLIGVYAGRPFENWTYQRIMRDLGEIDYYVNDRLGQPLVVTDDDVAGTFTFVRALEDHGARADLSSSDVGETWLNYIVENRSILWWGGNGNSTEHTAWLNLKKGIAAPASGSKQTNGTAVAEQIGAQIFIDGWAMVAPGNPELAARLAEQAAKVSHDGAAVDAAMLWAAMEAEAFVSRDVDHLLEVGLAQIAEDSPLRTLIADVRAWHRQFPDWRDSRQKIEDQYGYDKYPGHCHVVPNHAIMIMAALYASDDFSRAQTIINTSGWDTDCNAGNVGCLVGIMLGLEGIDSGRDWRGPLGDRMLISCADGGSAINDAVRTAYKLVDLGRRLSDHAPMQAPKKGAQFHFSLPGSVQGFRSEAGYGARGTLALRNEPFEAGCALVIDYRGLKAVPASAMTPTFAPPDVVHMRTYELMATPLVYPGQTVSARLVAASGNTAPVRAALRFSVYGKDDALRTVDGEPVSIAPGGDTLLRWRLPDLGGQPIEAVGIALSSVDGTPTNGALVLDYLRWDGEPDLHLRRPAEPSDFWRRAWVNNVSFFSKNFGAAFRISQDRGEGMITHGTREWRDYRVNADISIHLALRVGVAVRVQGLRRFYAVYLQRAGKLQIAKVYDGVTTVLAETDFPLAFEKTYQIEVEVQDTVIRCKVAGHALEAADRSATLLADGGIALVVAEGALSTHEVRVQPLKR